MSMHSASSQTCQLGWTYVRIAIVLPALGARQGHRLRLRSSRALTISAGLSPPRPRATSAAAIASTIALHRFLLKLAQFSAAKSLDWLVRCIQAPKMNHRHTGNG